VGESVGGEHRHHHALGGGEGDSHGGLGQADAGGGETERHRRHLGRTLPTRLAVEQEGRRRIGDVLPNIERSDRRRSFPARRTHSPPKGRHRLKDPDLRGERGGDQAPAVVQADAVRPVAVERERSATALVALKGQLEDMDVLRTPLKAIASGPGDREVATIIFFVLRIYLFLYL